MFSFDDLQYGEPLGLQALLARLNKQTLCAAMRGASDETRDRLFGQMSRRAERQLRDDMEYMGPIPRREVSKAQSHIESVARTMIKAGELVIIRLGDEDGCVDEPGGLWVGCPRLTNRCPECCYQHRNERECAHRHQHHPQSGVTIVNMNAAHDESARYEYTGDQ